MLSSWFSCFDLWRSAERRPLLSVRPSTTFPPPHTIVVAPTPRASPLASLAALFRNPLSAFEYNPANDQYRSYNSCHEHHSPSPNLHTRPLSIIEYAEARRESRREEARQTEERKRHVAERQEAISSAYGNRMCKVDRYSLPPTPTSSEPTTRRTSASSDQLGTPYCIEHTLAAASFPTHQSYGAIGLGSAPPESRSRLRSPPPPFYSSRRNAPGLVVTPGSPDHPSITPPLSPTKHGVNPLTPIIPTITGIEQGRGVARSLPDTSRTSSRTSLASLTSATTHTHSGSRSTSRSRSVHGQDVVYKEIGLAGLATVKTMSDSSSPTPSRRRRRHRKRTSITWFDEKERMPLHVDTARVPVLNVTASA